MYECLILYNIICTVHWTKKKGNHEPYPVPHNAWFRISDILRGCVLSASST